LKGEKLKGVKTAGGAGGDDESSDFKALD